MVENLVQFLKIFMSAIEVHSTSLATFIIFMTCMT